MIRRHLKTLRLGLMALDWASATAIVLLASIVRFGDGQWMQIWHGLGLDIRVVAALFGVAWVSALWYQGLYTRTSRSPRMRSLSSPTGRRTGPTASREQPLELRAVK